VAQPYLMSPRILHTYVLGAPISSSRLFFLPFLRGLIPVVQPILEARQVYDKQSLLAWMQHNEHMPLCSAVKELPALAEPVALVLQCRSWFKDDGPAAQKVRTGMAMPHVMQPERIRASNPPRFPNIQPAPLYRPRPFPCTEVLSLVFHARVQTRPPKWAGDAASLPSLPGLLGSWNPASLHALSP
jgi:hypothetical protein